MTSLPSSLLRAARIEPATPILMRECDAFYSKRRRRLVFCVGRGGRKTSTAAEVCAFEAVIRHREHEKLAKPGTRLTYPIIAPGVRQGREAYRALCAVLDALAHRGVRYETRGEGDTPELTITSPRTRCEAVIVVLPADPSVVRGFAIPFVWATEAGHFPTTGAGTLGAVLDAIEPRMAAQFGDGARVLLESTPGAPEGRFYEHVEKPDGQTKVVRMATYEAVPSISKEALRAGVSDPRVFAQEIEARAWGLAGETLIDAGAVEACIDRAGRHTGKGPRAGHFSIGSDFAAVRDGAAIVVCSCFFVEVPGSAPVRNVVIERAALRYGSRAKPILVRDHASKLAQTSRAFGQGRVRADAHSGPEFAAELRERGVPFEVVAMTPEAQTTRWRLLADLIAGQRLHIPPDAPPELVAQLSSLRATELRSGLLRVDGAKHDDLADALALAAEGALRLPPTDSMVVATYDPVAFEPGAGIVGGTKRWWRVRPDGSREPAEPPYGTPEFDEYARHALEVGVRTAQIDRWLIEQEGAAEAPPVVWDDRKRAWVEASSVTVPVLHG